MIQVLFDWCVAVLDWLAYVFGTTYEAVNVWVFCVIWPACTLVMLFDIIRLRRKTKRAIERQKIKARDPEGQRQNI